MLVVEYEPAWSALSPRILTDGGYRVVTAANGAQAQHTFRRHRCDAVLTDVIMLEMSGRRLAELLHERQPDLPVLLMSGYSNGLLGTTHILSDDVTFIEKPFTATDLLGKLASVHQTSPGTTGVTSPIARTTPARTPAPIPADGSSSAT